MQGLHLTADLHHCQCDTAWLTDAARHAVQRGEVVAPQASTS